MCHEENIKRYIFGGYICKKIKYIDTGKEASNCAVHESKMQSSEKFNILFYIDNPIIANISVYVPVLGRPKGNSRYYLTFKSTFKLKNQRNWLKQVKMLKWNVINCVFVH